MLTCRVFMDGLGRAWLHWSNGSTSYMPDESTARRCAAAGAMQAACVKRLEEGYADARNAERKEPPSVTAARAALSLALNGPAKGE